MNWMELIQSDGLKGVGLVLMGGLAFKTPDILKSHMPSLFAWFAKRWESKDKKLIEAEQQKDTEIQDLKKQLQDVQSQLLSILESGKEDAEDKADYWQNWTLRLLHGEKPETIWREMRRAKQSRRGPSFTTQELSEPSDVEIIDEDTPDIDR